MHGTLHAFVNNPIWKVQGFIETVNKGVSNQWNGTWTGIWNGMKSNSTIFLKDVNFKNFVEDSVS